jgi:acetyl esterase/lipase
MEIEIDRRALLAGSFAVAAAAPAVAQTLVRPKIEAVPLWPGRPPGGETVTVQQRAVRRSPKSPPSDIATYGVTRPTLTIVRPQRPNGTAMLLLPGGGYERVAMESDGGAIPRYLADRGFTVGALLYRLPYDGWAAGPDAPLQDAQRAFRLLARDAGPGARLGTIGFSAGGHLAGMLATRFDERTYASIDAADSLPARPSFAGLFFPVVTMTSPYAHEQSRRNLIGNHPTAEQIRRSSVEQNVRKDMPPTFVSAAADDRVVPVENSLMLFSAMRQAGVPGALHIFDVGGHGLGGLAQSGPGHFWPELFQDWLSRQS